MCSPTSHECKAHGRHHEKGDCLMCKEKLTCAYNNRPSYASLESQLTEAKSDLELHAGLLKVEQEENEQLREARESIWRKLVLAENRDQKLEQENNRLREQLDGFKLAWGCTHQSKALKEVE